MSSLSKVRADVTRKLRQPSERSLADGGFIDEAAVEIAAELVNEMNQTREPWFLMDFLLPVDANRDEYNIESMAPQFGKARFVYTVDDTDPQFQRRSIDIVPMEQLTDTYGAGQTNQVASNVKHSAEAVAFVYDYKMNAHKALVAPVPSLACQYKVIYQPDVATVNPGVVFRFSQFDGYLTDLIALACVALCEWDDFASIADPMQRDAANRARRQELEAFLQSQITRRADLFRRFKWSSDAERSMQTIGFGQHRWS